MDDADIKSTLKRVHALVSCYTPPYLDRENITMEIVLESWSHRIEQPSMDFIKNRCFNVMRELKLNQRSVRNKLREQKQTTPPTTKEIENQDEVNMLTKCLNNLEKKIVIHIFMMEMNIKETSEVLKLSVLTVSETLQGALFKMREAAQ